MKFLRAALPTIVVGCTLLAACTSNDEQQTPPTVLGMTDTLAPMYDDGEVQIYQVQTPVKLPIMRPSDAQSKALGPQAPYPHMPFYLASNARVSVKYTVSNLDPQNKHVVELLLDPWNEFVRYVPGVQIQDEQTVPNVSGIDKYLVLQPLQRVEGIITPDDMTELAVDLGTAMALAKNPPDPAGAFGGPVLYNRAFNVQNRSTQPDPLLAPYIPAVAAGITGFDLGLRTGEPAKIAVEINLDITDETGKSIIPQDDTTDKPLDRPGTILAPPAAADQGG